MYRSVRHANLDVMITITIDVILISLMGCGVMTFPVLMLLTYRLYLQIIFIDRLVD